MITEEQKLKVQKGNDLLLEDAELRNEFSRINAFLERSPDNKDNARAINQGKIFTKFAGTACMLPVGIFTAELTKRKKEIEDRLTEIEVALINL